MLLIFLFALNHFKAEFVHLDFFLDTGLGLRTISFVFLDSCGCDFAQ